ncbi:MAG: insulinase family protein, partial [Pseudomonadota bacterium]
MMRAFLLSGAAALTLGLTLGAGSPAMADGHTDSAEAPTLSAPKIEYTRWVLDNGLEVIALPDDSTANATTSLWYKVGSKHDPEGRAGFSHLFEHILSRKTVNMPY